MDTLARLLARLDEGLSDEERSEIVRLLVQRIVIHTEMGPRREEASPGGRGVPVPETERGRCVCSLVHQRHGFMAELHTSAPCDRAAGGQAKAEGPMTSGAPLMQGEPPALPTPTDERAPRPQTEPFVRFPVSLYDALLASPLPATHQQLILAVIRRTYGDFGKREAAIAVSQFKVMTRRAERGIRDGLAELVREGVLDIVRPATNRTAAVYRVITDPGTVGQVRPRDTRRGSL